MAMDEKLVERLIGCVPFDVEDSRTIKEAEREAVGYVSPENMAAFLKHGMSVDLQRRYWAGGIPLYTRPPSKAEIGDLAQALTLAQARIRELETALAARSAEPVAWRMRCCDPKLARRPAPWVLLTDDPNNIDASYTVQPLYTHPKEAQP